MFRNLILCCGLALLFSGCRQSYDPPAISAPNNYLVVEGFINSGADSTIIKLSETVNLSSKTVVNPVIGASVMVQNNQNATALPLTGDGHGNYVAVGLNLSPSMQYRLAIVTSNGSYQSDFVPVKPTPPIDSVGYIIKNNGVQIYVNTHDPANNTTFYRWDYQETWIFYAEYDSSFIADFATHTIITRVPSQWIYHCFGNDVSSTILVTSTQHLGKDVVYQSPLTFIPFSSEKLEQKYSILVKQYALTPDAYTFYENLKNNTQQLGTIFDPLPSQINGNIHSVSNSGVPVIGFVSITNVQSKRIFISADEWPYVPPVYPYSCKVDTCPPGQEPETFFTKPYDFVPILLLNGRYTFSATICVDCTVRGTTQIPSFWK